MRKVAISIENCVAHLISEGREIACMECIPHISAEIALDEIFEKACQMMFHYGVYSIKMTKVKVTPNTAKAVITVNYCFEY